MSQPPDVFNGGEIVLLPGVLNVLSRVLDGARDHMAAALRVLLFAGLAVGLAGCSSNMGSLFGGSGSSSRQAQPAPGAVNSQAANINQQGVKVGLLLPLSSGGDSARVAKAMKQAAELAMLDSGSPGIVLVTKDTQGSASGARQAAQAALNEGAQLILGPLFSSSVQAVAPVARQQSVPVIAFSSVSSVADAGVYLMSFPPEQEVASVTRYAIAQGLRNIAALVPQSQYGNTVERALHDTARANGGRIVALERFARNQQSVAEPAKRVASVVSDQSRNVQALMIAEGGTLLRAIGATLNDAGVNSGSVKTLGTGLWDDQTVRTVPIAINGWYAGVSPNLVSRFDQKYAATYGGSPPRLASLAYDAVSMAIAMERSGGGSFSSSQITNSQGFQGMNGLFRFRTDGRIERGLAILEVTPSGPRVVQPAPSRFSGTGF